MFSLASFSCRCRRRRRLRALFCFALLCSATLLDAKLHRESSICFDYCELVCNEEGEWGSDPCLVATCLIACCCFLNCFLYFWWIVFGGDDQCIGTLLTFLSGASTDAQSGLSVSLSVWFWSRGSFWLLVLRKSSWVIVGHLGRGGSLSLFVRCFGL